MLSAQLLEKIPEHLRKSGMLRLGSGSASLLTTGTQLAQGAARESIQSSLLKGELLQGGVVELCAQGGASLGTSIALRACRRLQEEALHSSEDAPWCAFVDPTASLYAPGVQAAGVDLQRLLIVRPDESTLSRVALRLVESKAFPLVVIDTMGLPGSSFDISLAPWVRVVRRLSLALAGTRNTVVLLTQKNAYRPLPLPVAQRIELSRSTPTQLNTTVLKSTNGTDLGPQSVRWVREPIQHAS